MASVIIQIRADASSALQTVTELENRLKNLKGNVSIGGSNGNESLSTQMRDISASTSELNSVISTLSNTITRTFVGAMKSALSEMKAVDTELVNVRKVTLRSTEQMAATEAKAYEMGKKYGTSASDYLASVTTFARAGYKDQSEALAELSTQLQLAGNVTQTVADKFITAVDNAYKFGGNIQNLTAVMDGLNQIGNEFPTSVDEVASGIGKVASIAATTHTGIDELSAAIGTISAVTQRSGNEAATALRALFLNIIGDTKTEIEDGAKWTAGEIDGLRRVLDIYASDVVKAAEASGSVIKPMEAIGALAQAVKEGTLTESELMSMVTDIGGKLRSNQLMVLLNNWDMYQSMLQTYHGAAGSMNREIQNAMDSWVRKTNMIESSWTELVSKSISGGAIKGTLDVVLNLVSAFGSLENVVTGVGGALLALNSGRIVGGLRNILTAIKAGGLSTGLSVVGIGAMVASAAVTAYNAYNNELDKRATQYTENAVKAASNSKNIVDLYMDFSSAAEGTEAYTSALENLKSALEGIHGGTASAGQSIHQFTQQVLAEQTAIAKSNYDQLESQYGQGGTFGIGAKGKEFTSFMDSLTFTLKNWNGGFIDEAFGKIIGSKESTIQEIANGDIDSIERIIRGYEIIRDLRMEMALYAKDNTDDNGMFLNVADSFAYGEIDKFLTKYQEAYQNVMKTAQSFGDALSYELPFLRDTESQKAIQNVEQFESKVRELMNLVGGHGMASEFANKNILTEMAKLFPEFAQQSQEFKTLIEQSGGEVNFDTSDATQAAEEFANALTNATKAKNAFDAAMQHEEENTGYQGDKSVFNQWDEEIQAGRTHSRAARAAAKYLLGESVYNDLMNQEGGGMDLVNQTIQKSPLGFLFGAEAEYKYEDYGERFVAYMNKIADAQGQVVDGSNNIVASFTKESGKTRMQISDYYGLWKAMGGGEETIGMLGNALLAFGVYGDQFLDGPGNALIDLIKETDSMVEGDALGDYVVNIGKLFESGDSRINQETVDMLHTFSELGFIKLTNAKEGWWQPENWKNAMGGEETVETVQAVQEGMEGAAEGAEAAKEAAEEAGAEIQNVDGNIEIGFTQESEDPALAYAAKVTEQSQAASEAVKQVTEALSGIDGDYEAAIEIIYDSGRISAIRTTAETLDGMQAGYMTTFTYNEEGDIASMTTTVSSVKELGEEGNEHITTKYTYTPEGLQSLTSTVTRVNALGQAESVITTNYTFKENGDIDKITKVGEGVKGIDPSATTTYTFDPAGNVSKITEVHTNLEGIKNAETTYTFKEDGTVLKSVIKINEATGLIDSEVTTEYKLEEDKELATKVADIQTEVGGLPSGTQTLNFSFNPNLARTAAGVSATNAQLNAVKDKEAKITATADVDAISDQVDAVNEQLSRVGHFETESGAEHGSSGGGSFGPSTGDANFSGYSSAAEALAELISGPTPAMTVQVTADTEPAKEALEDLEEDKAQAEEPVEATVSANIGGAESYLEWVKSTLEDLDSYTATPTVNVSTNYDTIKGGNHAGAVGGNGTGGVDALLGYTNATGTPSFRGGLSLINEEGAELVTFDGMARILGGGKPTIANIPRGATIYTASETAEILKGVHAFAGGLTQDFDNKYISDELAKKEKEKEAETKTGNGNGNQNPWANQNKSSSKSSEKDESFWETIKEYIDYGLQKIEDAITERKLSIEALEKAKKVLLDPIDDEIEGIEYAVKLIDYEIALLERKRDDAQKPLDDEIDRLKKEKELLQDQETEEEKLKALEEARANLEEARHQRTVRIFNEEKGQWEWIADQKAIESAEEKLKDEEKAWAEYQLDKRIDELEAQKDEIEQAFKDATADFEAQKQEMERRQEDLEHQKGIVEHQYAEAEEPINDEMDELQSLYDQLSAYYTKLQHAVEVPTESLEDALKKMSKAEERFKAQVANTTNFTDVLKGYAGGWGAWPLDLIGLGAAQQAVSQNTATVVNEGDVIINGISLGAEAKSMTLDEVLRLAGVYGA